MDGQNHEYYRGEEIQYDLNHLQWQINRIIDEKNSHLLERYLQQCIPEPGIHLDLACGSGRTLDRLKGKSRHQVGLDLSEGLIRLAYDKKVIASFLIGDASKLPFLDNSFELVTINGALHHIDDDYEAVMEAGRVLKPGGLLAILGEPSSRYMRWRNPFFILTMAFQWMIHPKKCSQVIRERRERGFENVCLEEGAHTINPERVRHACRASGIQQLACHSYDYFPRLYSKSSLATSLYCVMLRFEELVLSRILPLNGTVFCYYGVKNHGESAGLEIHSNPR